MPNDLVGAMIAQNGVDVTAFPSRHIQLVTRTHASHNVCIRHAFKFKEPRDMDDF